MFGSVTKKEGFVVLPKYDISILSSFCVCHLFFQKLLATAAFCLSATQTLSLYGRCWL
jgi:hypothetical protein